ncbi:MAG TPA: glutathione-dependent disulfide-bond oxidoreductase [Gammaproteobacteria bacterium]|nr:glutathione-dependent disulfide-bond oxidoreductase [Gammaproteobacteria bacterium]HBF08072.1 glutathione-dependent disulfide-bond oxidoreductase [Gammaproteobacteria bacterium]HCK94514.1 glutathione-dependent disulfide-bond oxidoreductase [Gammaproteobacteria bacterium]
MSQSKYTPPKVWSWQKDENAGHFGAINQPTAGARFDKELQKGKHDLQLYSLATPNGVKVTVLLEELIEAQLLDDYDAWVINIMEQDQFGSDFVAINPNSKIPALMDYSVSPPQRLFESGSILFYLAEKYNAFLPEDASARTECMNWLFWQMASAPILGGGFGHFYAYAPEPIEYPINRYTMEVKRQLDVLDQHLAQHQFMVGNEYTIADMAIWPWYGVLALGELYEAGEFLDVQSYEHVQRWAKAIAERPAVQRGKLVNRTWGDKQLPNRHSKDDFAQL